jgi:hypothetical protein
MEGTTEQPVSEVEYVVELSPGNRLRERFVKHKGKILEFIVQFEVWIEGKWQPVVRYDTAHGFAHRDELRPDGMETKTPLYFPSYNDALTFAEHDIKMNWKWYEERYKTWKKG